MHACFLFCRKSKRSVHFTYANGTTPPLFTHAHAKRPFSVLSYLEIYNEVITDLLKPASTALQIRDGDIKRGVYVEELSETNVLNRGLLWA